MKDKLKGIGWALLGFLILIAIFIVIGLFIGGASWLTEKLVGFFLSEKILGFFALASLIAFGVLLVVLLPLSLLRRTREIAAVGIHCLSYVFGATAWMYGLLATLKLLGAWAVFLGLIMFGLGVVPLGILAAIFHGQWLRMSDLVVLSLLTFGSRSYAAHIDKKGKSSYLPVEELAYGELYD